MYKVKEGKMNFEEFKEFCKERCYKEMHMEPISEMIGGEYVRFNLDDYTVFDSSRDAEDKGYFNKRCFKATIDEHDEMLLIASHRYQSQNETVYENVTALNLDQILSIVNRDAIIERKKHISSHKNNHLKVIK